MKSKLVKQWYRYAATDLKLAKNALSFSNEFKGAAAFNAQQCAEKVIKAYLTYHKMRFPKTHNIEQLVSLVAEKDSKLAQKILKAKVLTKYAVEYRYPDAERKPMTVAKAKAAIKLAEMVFNACVV